MTASAGTSSTAPPAAKPATIRPVAVLLCRMAVTPRPAANAASRLPQRGAEHAAQIGAEGALDAGLHHVHAPQQQGDGAGEIEQGPHRRSVFGGQDGQRSDRQRLSHPVVIGWPGNCHKSGTDRPRNGTDSPTSLFRN